MRLLIHSMKLRNFWRVLLIRKTLLPCLLHWNPKSLQRYLQNFPSLIMTEISYRIKNYVHTDNNFTTSEKEKLAGLANYDDTAITKSINDEITRSKAAESALSGKLDELSKVALADVGYFAIEYGDEESSSQADPAVTIINQPYYDYFMAKWEAANKPCEKKTGRY